MPTSKKKDNTSPEPEGFVVQTVFSEPPPEPGTYVAGVDDLIADAKGDDTHKWPELPQHTKKKGD
jgi:hypothetical protein